MAEYVLREDLNEWAKAGDIVTLGTPIPGAGQWFEDGGPLHHADLVPVYLGDYLAPVAYLTDHNLDRYFEPVA